ncbi:MAG: lipooligosaccharide transport system ATP-binding protein [Actinomycetota bacterium]|nr:lipooligosaccharide transport system ATP-binding protein [Actinomycetota bacterium]
MTDVFEQADDLLRASAPEVVIHARNLTKSHGPVQAVRGINVDVLRGESFGFLGPNGAGKSSTMKMIACTSPPTSGTLRVLGHDPVEYGSAIRGRLGVCPQEDSLDTEITVEENLTVYARYFGLSRKQASTRSADLLEFVHLTEKRKAKVDALSGGMKRRLTIARSLINDPEILLLDEPTTGLDPQARHVLWDRLYRLRQSGVTLVLTTHYMDEAEQLCDRLVIMDNGIFVAEGSPAQLIRANATREVAELRFPPGDHHDLADRIGDLAERVEVLPDRLLLYVENGEDTLRLVNDRGIRPVGSLVRRSSLEDVFLRLTGRSLAE